MKIIKYILTAIAAVVVITACQKELDFVTDGLAHGSLKSDATGDCLPATINGIYKADSLLDNTNFVDIQVDLNSTGTYDIKSDTVNGYSFRGTGTLGIVGVNSVRLYATGKPLLSGTDNFTIKFDSTICIVSVTVIGTGTGVAVYTLGGSPGNCSASVNGIYTQGTALDVNNTVTLTVNVTITGTYALGAASINGMLFTATGVFSSTGVQAVTLNGAGTPVDPGLFNVTATNLTSTCTFDIQVIPSGTGGPAVYTLNTTAGDCSGAAYSGTFITGVALTTNEAVLINATVTVAGTYTVTTNTVNGMTFSGSGTFPAAGQQQIVLIGSGTPTAAGIFNYTATAGLSTCIFSVTVVDPASINLDYVPETAFSNWSDKLVGGTAGDTAYVRVSPNTIIKNGITYKIFETQINTVPSDSSFHRKNGGLYYQLYDQPYGFDNPFNIDGLLLDSTQAVNYSWTTNLGNNTVNGGTVPATGKIVGLITEKAATATIAGNAYSNIIKVTYAYSYNIGAADVIYAVEEIWYSKGKGVVYYKANDVPVTFTDVYETTRTQIF